MLRKTLTLCALAGLLAACSMQEPAPSPYGVDAYDGSQCWAGLPVTAATADVPGPYGWHDENRPSDPRFGGLMHLCNSNPTQEAILFEEYKQSRAAFLVAHRQWEAQHPDAERYIIRTPHHQYGCVTYTEGDWRHNECQP